MKGKVVPSSKPKIEGLVSEELHHRIEEFLRDRDISRSKLVQLAIELYLDQSQIHIPLELDDQRKLEKLAKRDCRTFELEAQYAIQSFIEENEDSS